MFLFLFSGNKAGQYVEQNQRYAKRHFDINNLSGILEAHPYQQTSNQNTGNAAKPFLFGKQNCRKKQHGNAEPDSRMNRAESGKDGQQAIEHQSEYRRHKVQYFFHCQTPFKQPYSKPGVTDRYFLYRPNPWLSVQTK